MRKNSRFEVLTSGEQVEGERFAYPAMIFVKRKGEKEDAGNI